MNRIARTSLLALCSSMVIAACDTATERQQTGSPKPPPVSGPTMEYIQQRYAPVSDLALIPDRVINPNQDPVLIFEEQSGTIPDIHGPIFFAGGAFTFPNGTVPGNASFTLAPVIDFMTGPPGAWGTGTYDVTVAGTNYNSLAAESITGVFNDPSTNTDYLVVSSFTEVTQPSGTVIGTVVHVVVLASDFAIGATVQFDGNDRLAFFATGDINLPDPQYIAVAATGSVTFTAGGLALGDLVTATLSGDFGEIPVTPSNPPPIGGTITPGPYTIAFITPTDVECDGTLIGQEAAFAALLPADVGFVGGTISVALPLSTQVEVSGAPISGAFGGAATLMLENYPELPPGTFIGGANISGSGPTGTNTNQNDAFLFLDGDSATATSVVGAAGASFVTPNQDGFCGVSFGVELTP